MTIEEITIVLKRIQFQFRDITRPSFPRTFLFYSDRNSGKIIKFPQMVESPRRKENPSSPNLCIEFSQETGRGAGRSDTSSFGTRLKTDLIPPALPWPRWSVLLGAISTRDYMCTRRGKDSVKIREVSGRASYKYLHGVVHVR